MKSRQKIKAFVDTAPIQKRWQKVEIGHGLSVGTRERWQSFRLAMPTLNYWQDATYIAIGSMLGAMPFYAEAHGTEWALGLDKREEFTELATQIADLKDSQCEFETWDVLGDTRPRTHYKADIVSMFNVIHHLPMPGYALRKALGMARKYFTIEYPVPDMKHQKYMGIPQKVTDVTKGYPVIMPFSNRTSSGALDTGFYYTPEAMKLMVEWFGDWREVVSVQSPHRHDRWLQTFERYEQ